MAEYSKLGRCMHRELLEAAPPPQGGTVGHGAGGYNQIGLPDRVHACPLQYLGHIYTKNGSLCK